MSPAELIRDFLLGVVAVSMAGSVAWSSYLGALRLCGLASVAVRLGATAIVAWWLMGAIFWAASVFLAFRLTVMAPFVLALAAIVHVKAGGKGRAVAQLRADARAMRAFLGGTIRTLEGWLLLTVAGVAVTRALRVGVSAPLAWDDLTYHLVKAARFVQDGGVVAVAAPGAWSYYEYFPPVGDIVWAWAMLPLRSEALVPVMSSLIWAATVLGTFSCAREYGAPRREALLAASAIGAMPAVLTYVGTAYVDNMVLACFVLAALFIVRIARGASREEMLLVAAALGVMLGSKLTSAPVVVLALLILCGVMWGSAKSSVRWFLLAGAVGAIVALPSYVRAWLAFGSPIYPLPLKLAGHTLLQGNRLVEQYSIESLPPVLRLHSPLDFWAFTLIRPGPWGAFNALGPGAVLLLLLAAIGLPAALRQASRAAGTLFLVGSGLAVSALLASDSMRFVRQTVDVTTTGRYFTSTFAAAAIIGALAPGPSVRVLCIPAIAAGAFMSLPGPWLPVEGILMAGGVAILLFAISAGALGIIWASRRGSVLVPLLAVALGLSLTLPWLLALRQSDRYGIFAAAAARPPIFHLHPLNPIFASAWPVWEALDQRQGQTIALTAGWEIVGHHWYQLPLFGSRLQNRVVYVPITGDGAIVEPKDTAEVLRRASFAAWLRRIVDGKVDYVVSLAPRTTIEDFWMRRTPQVFTPAYADARRFHVAFRVDRAAAERILRAREADSPRR